MSRAPTATPTPGMPLAPTSSHDVPAMATMPPPATFDILPPLHELLSRLLFAAGASSGGATNGVGGKSTSGTLLQQQQQQSGLGASVANTQTSMASVGGGTTDSSNTQTTLTAVGSQQTSTSPGHLTATQTGQVASTDSQSGGAADAARPYPGARPLDIQQLTGEVAAVRARLRHARESVLGLADMSRSIEQQEREIAALRRREEAMRGVLAGLRETTTAAAS